MALAAKGGAVGLGWIVSPMYRGLGSSGGERIMVRDDCFGRSGLVWKFGWIWGGPGRGIEGGFFWRKKNQKKFSFY